MKTAGLKDIVGFIDDYLKTGEVHDYSWNGLQVEGKERVKKVAFAVDAAVDTFNMAARAGADLVVVHHGHFWKGVNPSLRSWAKERIRILYKNGISLYASHLPLDKHREVGNNAQLLKLLEAKITGEFGVHDGTNIGWIGKISPPVRLNKIKERLDKTLPANCKVLNFGKGKISTVAALSGGGGYEIFFEALERGVDLYITGDSIEVYHTAKDAGFNVIFAGHHATETLGVKALSRVVGRRFGVETVFLDLPTGL